MECHDTTCCSDKRIDLFSSQNSSPIHDRVKDLLMEEQFEYVLVTCRKVSRNKNLKEKKLKEQKMEVELSFEGDPILASFLVHGAQEFFDQTLAVELEE